MGNETILYYVTEEFVTGSRRTEKGYFWRKIKLPSFVVEEGNITTVTIMVPDLKKGWKREKLLRQMQEAVLEYPMYSGNAQVLVQPEVQRILAKQDAASGKSELVSAPGPAGVPESAAVFKLYSGIISHTEWHLAETILKKALLEKSRKVSMESVVFLLGNTLFPEEQMGKFMEMMQPYFPRINHLLILYKTDEEIGIGDAGSEGTDSGKDGSRETDGGKYGIEEVGDRKDGNGNDEEGWQERNRWEEVIYEYVQEIYYEYGLVTQVQNGSGRTLKKHSVRIGQGEALFLDFGYPETIPLRVLKAGDFYLDVFSSEMKSALFRRKHMEISYASPRKYLDTIVKSGYDKLVNRTLCQKITRENKT